MTDEPLFMTPAEMQRAVAKLLPSALAKRSDLELVWAQAVEADLRANPPADGTPVHDAAAPDPAP
jgi:hypothetical protein